ncbi:hypothetical protein ABIE45_002965 [Methylobacterium sp. OAE515]
MSKKSAAAMIGPGRSLIHAVAAAGLVVQPVDLVAGEALEQPVLQHGPGAAAAFLGRLEHEHRGAVEVAGLGEVAGRADQHRGVPIMAAGVHLAGIGRAVGEVGLLLDGQGVHVGAQADALPVVGTALEQAHHPGAADAAMHLAAEFLEEIGHDAGGAHLLKAELRMGVQIAAQGSQLVGIGLDVVDRAHVSELSGGDVSEGTVFEGEASGRAAPSQAPPSSVRRNGVSVSRTSTASATWARSRCK